MAAQQTTRYVFLLSSRVVLAACGALYFIPYTRLTIAIQGLRCPFTDGFVPSTTTSSSTRNDTSTPIRNIPSGVAESLPTVYHKPGRRIEAVFKTADNLLDFLELDLDFSRLNKIHSSLWACGRPFHARPLHRHKVMSRQIIPTEQADLHLLYHSGMLLLKPLPSYILCRQLWEDYLCLDEHEALHKSACGMLISYTWLIRSPLDFRIATSKDLQLLPKGLEWIEWKKIVDETLDYIDTSSLVQVNQRFQFGELRLSRINSIYRLRFAHTHFVRGYLYGYNRYVPFFKRNIAWILAFSVLLSLVLSASKRCFRVPTRFTLLLTCL
jgi:hypothetical protein